MKKLNEPVTEPQNITLRQQLISEIVSWVDCFHCEGMEREDIDTAINSILSKYDVSLSELTSVIVDIPELEGKEVTIHYNPTGTEQMFKGKVVKVLYRGIAYSMADIVKILMHPDITEERKTMIHMTAYEETKPKIYHRIVLNDENQGILIVPLVKGVTIE